VKANREEMSGFNAKPEETKLDTDRGGTGLCSII
jgi:hypothetical protein